MVRNWPAGDIADILTDLPLEDHVLEYVDHLHEHFVDPVTIKGGRYMPPSRPGYSIEMKPESLREYAYPGGAAWS